MYFLIQGEGGQDPQVENSTLFSFKKLESESNIKCVNNISGGGVNISYGTAGILRGVPNILHVHHQCQCIEFFSKQS